MQVQALERALLPVLSAQEAALQRAAAMLEAAAQVERSCWASGLRGGMFAACISLIDENSDNCT